MEYRDESPGLTLGAAQGELLMVAFEQAPLGIALLSADGRLLRANAALAEIFGQPQDALERLSWQALIHPDDAAEMASIVARAIAHEIDHVQVELRFLAAGGRVVRLQAWGRPLLDDEGEVTHFIAHVRDVTGERAREEELLVQGQIVANLGEGVVMERVDTREILYVNHAFEELLRYPCGALVGRRTPDLVAPGPSGLEPMAARLQTVVDTGRWSGEIKLLASDGEAVWVQANASAFEHPGHGTVIVSVHNDITARKHAEARNQQLAAIVEGSGEAIVGTDLDERITSWNRAAERMFGYPAADVVGRRLLDVLAVEDPALVAQRFEAARQGADQPPREYDTYRADGSLVHLDGSISPVCDEHGTVVGLSLVMRDVSERREAQDLARRLASIVDQSLDAIVGFDVEGRITSWNAAAERIYQRSADEVIGAYAWDLAIPETRDAIRERLTGLIAGGEWMRIFETEHLRADGTRLPVEVSMFRLHDSAGNVAGASVIARDISGRRAAERDAAMLSAIVANTQVAVVATDPDDIVTGWNPAAERMFGWTADEIVGQSYGRLVPAEDRAESLELVARAVAGESVTFERQRLHRDGTLVDVAISLAPMAGPDGVITGVATLLQDITPRCVAERSAAEERARLRAIINHAPSVVFLKAPDGRYLLVNDHFCGFFGRTEEELLGLTDFDVFPEAFARDLRRLDEDLAATGRIFQEEERVPDAEGVFHTYFTVKFPVYGPEGELQGIGGFSTDITDLKAAERDRARLAAIVESSSDAIMVITLDQTVVAWNHGAEVMIGRSAAEKVGKRILDGSPEWLAADIDALVDDVIAGGTVAGRRMTFLTASRRKVPVSVSAAALLDERGEPYGVAVIARDVSDILDAERTLDTRARELARSNADLESFAYAASHDLQEPLRVIALAAEVVKTGETDVMSPDSAEMLDLILASTRRMSDQIDALLALARIGQARPPTEPVSADDALDDALDALRVSIAESRATVLHEPLGGVLVERTQLVTVLQNLISNAIKFASPGEPPHVSIRARRTDDRVEIEVADRGIGIEPRDQERIFRVFQRGGDRSTQGVGIGLAVVRTIVERHGGTVHVESTAGEGTTFVLSFPMPPF